MFVIELPTRPLHPADITRNPKQWWMTPTEPTIV